MKNPARRQSIAEMEYYDAVEFLTDRGVLFDDIGTVAEGVVLPGGRRLTAAALIAKATRAGFRSMFSPRGGREANPKRLRISAAQLSRGVKQFERFQGRRATRGVRVKVPDPPRVVVRLGELVQVNYRTKKGRGQTVEYYHRFHRPLPILVCDPNGKALYVVGGRFKITDRGIEK